MVAVKHGVARNLRVETIFTSPVRPVFNSIAELRGDSFAPHRSGLEDQAAPRIFIEAALQYCLGEKPKRLPVDFFNKSSQFALLGT